MNKNLYTETMNKISMNEDCMERIIKETESENVLQYKPKRKIRFTPIIAAAAVALTCGTWAAAESGGFEWVKSFFTEISDDVEIEELTGEMENFNFQSTNSNISFEPVGLLADEQNLYCVIKPVGIELSEISLIDVYSESIYKKDRSAVYSCRIDEETGNIIVAYTLAESMFEDGNDVSIFLTNYDPLSQAINDCQAENPDLQAIDDCQTVGTYLADSEFNLTEYVPESGYDIYRIDFKAKFGNVKTVTIDSFAQDTTYSIKKLVITPLTISVSNDLGYIGEIVKVVMNDGSSISPTNNLSGNTAYLKSTSGSGTISEDDAVYKTVLCCQFENLINPENVSQVYINNTLIYEKE